MRPNAHQPGAALQGECPFASVLHSSSTAHWGTDFHLMRLRQQKQAQRYTHSPDTRDGDAATRGHGDGNRLVLPRVAASVFVAVSPLFNRVAPSSPRVRLSKGGGLGDDITTR